MFELLLFPDVLKQRRSCDQQKTSERAAAPVSFPSVWEPGDQCVQPGADFAGVLTNYELGLSHL